MAIYVISCEFREAGQSSESFQQRLAAWSAVQALETLWFIDTPSSAGHIRDDLRQFLSPGDGLFIGALSGVTAWHELREQSDRYLQLRFGG
jgi:hypothetical protein